jgi:hypothetical protein
MSNTNQTPPSLPTNVPATYAPLIATIASLIVFGVAPVLHQYFPQVPSLDLTTVQAALGVLIGIAIWVHSVGYQAAMKYVVSTALPQLLQQYGPQLESVVIAAIKAELNKNGDLGVLDANDIHAVKASRIARLAGPSTTA